MANVIITMKLMPEGVETDFSRLQADAKEMIISFAGEGEIKVEEEPIAFGLKALKLFFVMDESKGSTEDLEKQISKIEGVASVEITDVRRAIG